MKKIQWFLLCGALCMAGVVGAQTDTYRFDFDSALADVEVKQGKIEFSDKGAWKGKALKLYSDSKVFLPLHLQEGSTYRLTAWVRTESGADNVTMQLEGLGKNNISFSTAMATWIYIEREFHVSAGQRDAWIHISFDGNTGTCAWVDEVVLERTGDYADMDYTGIPPRAVREVKSDRGIEMQSDEKMTWMKDARLGMFIHWGLYAGPGRGEWYMENQGISISEYRKLAYPESGEAYFDASSFDARKWANLAKKAGMRYMNMVTQHHDGYALFESKYMDAFTSKQTHNRDFVREYVDACREAGLRVGLYKTLINWRYPGYYDIYGTNCKPNKFGYTTELWHKENARLMKEELYCQVKELMTNYGRIDQLFWDGGWIAQQGSDADGAFFWESGKYLDHENEWPVNEYFQTYEDSTGKALGLMGLVRKYQPDILVNPRSGWCGDYTCEEGGGAVKGPIRSGVVEKCVSLSPGWGYNKLMEDPKHVMPLSKIKRICADCMVRGMCFLVNIGPDRHGCVPKNTETRLLEFGEWTHAAAEAIYGTRGGPWQPVDGQYGFTYCKNKIYVYFLGGYTKEVFSFPPLDKGMRVKNAYDVCTYEKVSFKQKGNQVLLRNIRPVKDDITILCIELNRDVYTEP